MCARAINNWKSLIRVKGALSSTAAARDTFTRRHTIYARNDAMLDFWNENFSDRVAVFCMRKIFTSRNILWEFSSLPSLRVVGLSTLHHFPLLHEVVCHWSVEMCALPVKITNRMLRSGAVSCHAASARRISWWKRRESDINFGLSLFVPAYTFNASCSWVLVVTQYVIAWN